MQFHVEAFKNGAWVRNVKLTVSTDFGFEFNLHTLVFKDYLHTHEDPNFVINKTLFFL